MRPDIVVSVSEKA